MSFSFEFDISESEQVRASRIVLFRQRSTRRVLAFFTVFAVLLVAYLAIRPSRHTEGFPVVLVAGCAGVLAGVAAIYMAPRSTVRSLRKNNRAVGGPHVFGLGDAGLEIRSLGTTTSIEWPNIRDVYETRDFLFFYFSNAWAQLLPKRVIPPETVPGLRQALLQWAGTRAHLLD